MLNNILKVLGIILLLGLIAFLVMAMITYYQVLPMLLQHVNQPVIQQQPITVNQQPPAPTQDAPSAVDYGLVPQPYVPHPSSYQETGHTGSDSDKTITWTLQVLPNTVLIIGGYRVDGVDGGVYKAIAGPATVTTTVTDGFYSIVASEWGQNEYCFRLGEAIRYGWAHAHLSPLSGWSCQ
jgi:hypothetical protein